MPASIDWWGAVLDQGLSLCWGVHTMPSHCVLDLLLTTTGQERWAAVSVSQHSDEDTEAVVRLGGDVYPPGKGG